MSQLTWPCDETSPYPYIFADSTQVLQGDEVCIDVKINDFSGVNSFVFFIYFDSRYFEYVNSDLGNSGLPNFITSRIRYVPAAGPDLLRISWLSEGTVPHSLEDSLTLFSSCFKAVGAPGSSSDFIITRAITAFPTFTIQDEDLTLPAEEAIPCTFRDNTIIEIIPTSSNGPQLFLKSSCSSVNGGQNGIVEFSAFNGARPYTVVDNLSGDSFTLGSNISTFTLTDLPNADYSYYITDANNIYSDTISFSLEEREALSLISNIRPPNCFDSNNGFIDLETTGGTPFDFDFYRYEWSNGIQGIGHNLIARIDTGLYSVTIIDSTGCVKDTSFQIIEPIVTDKSQLISGTLSMDSVVNIAYCLEVIPAFEVIDQSVFEVNVFDCPD